MTKQWPTKLRTVLVLAVLTVAFFAPFGFFSDAWADINCNSVCEAGHLKCQEYCDSHNTISGAKWHKCLNQCDRYWYSGKNPQSIGHGDPTNPPKRVGPGQVKPPTTVKPPRTPPRMTGPGQVGNAPTSVGHPDPSPPPQLRSKRNH